MTRAEEQLDDAEELEHVRARILRVIELNPHTYESLQSYRVLRKREAALVAGQYPRGAAA